MIINDGGGSRPAAPRPAATTPAKPATTTSSSTGGGSTGARHVDHFEPPRSPAPAVTTTHPTPATTVHPTTSSGPPAGIPSDAWNHLPSYVQQQIQTHPTTTAPATQPATTTPASHPATTTTPAAPATTSGPPAGIPAEAWSHIPSYVQQQILAHPPQPLQPPPVQLNTPPTQSQMLSHPPPDLKIPMGEWHAMTPDERIALWTPPKNPELPTLPPYNQQQAHPPPGSTIDPHEWRDMTPQERTQAWNSIPHLEVPTLPAPNLQQASAPPNSHINPHEWHEMTPQERTQTWSSYVANNTQYVANPKLRDYLAAHPDVTTVQQLINQAVKSKDYNAALQEAGLDPKLVDKFRSANLADLAVVKMPPQGTLPRDVAQANVYHLVEFNTAPYGTPYNTATQATGTNNCGPASLAMALRISGQMPGGLNAEQQIDYARYLITNNTTGSVTTMPGTQIPVSDNDRQLLGFGAIAGAEQRANVPMTYTSGWAALDNSLNNGHPVVAAGYINGGWKAQFPDQGHYGSAPDGTGHFVAVVGKTPDGKYIVSDPMFTGGSTTMTREQLQKFFANGSPLITTVGQ